MEHLPRQIKWQLNQLVDQAYENELSRELEKLAARVDEWRAGNMTASELAHLIHKADTGPLRDLYKRDVRQYREVWIANALQRGLLQERDIPEQVWPYLQNAMAFIQANVDEDDVDDD